MLIMSGIFKPYATLIRPALDYNFFQALTEVCENDRNKKVRVRARRVREQLLAITEAIDAEQQAVVQQMGMMLEEIINSDNLEHAVRERHTSH